MHSKPVRTRFAPSPTGYLHIGGVRTALFNWLFARQHGGAFILRIDDTDVARNVDEALEPILSGLRWLGIDWDEGPGVGGPHAPYFQSQRADRHRAAVDRLLASGRACRRGRPSGGRHLRIDSAASSAGDPRDRHARGRSARRHAAAHLDGVNFAAGRAVYEPARRTACRHGRCRRRARPVRRSLPHPSRTVRGRPTV